MILPRYYFEGDFSPFIQWVETCAIEKIRIPKGNEIKYINQVKAIYIKSGMVKLTIINESGDESVVMLAGQGTIYPVTCLEEQFTIEQYMKMKTIMDTEIIVFERAEIATMISKNVEFAYAAMNFNSKTINSLLTKNILGNYETSEQSVCSFLYSYIKYNPNDNHTVNLTQEDIASITGLSRMQITRILSTLRQDRVVETIRGKVIVLDVDLLEKKCAGIMKEV